MGKPRFTSWPWACSTMPTAAGPSPWLVPPAIACCASSASVAMYSSAASPPVNSTRCFSASARLAARWSLRVKRPYSSVDSTAHPTKRWLQKLSLQLLHLLKWRILWLGLRFLGLLTRCCRSTLAVHPMDAMNLVASLQKKNQGGVAGYVSIYLVPPCGHFPNFLEMPLFMGRTALIFQNRFATSALFCNFTF